MVSTLSVRASYDDNLKFYPDGRLYSIPEDSVVMGTKDLPTSVSVPGITTPALTSPMLRVKTVEFGEIFLNMTLDAYNALIREANVLPNSLQNYTVSVVGSPTSVTASQLFNVSVRQVSVGGVIVDIRTVTYTQDVDNQTGAVDVGFALGGGTVVEVLYFNN